MMCLYVISTSTMYCYKDDKPMAGYPITGWTSGAEGPCKNNPKCANQEGGPAPPGLYYASPPIPRPRSDADNGYSQSASDPNRYYGARRMDPIRPGWKVDLTTQAGRLVDVGTGTPRGYFMTHHCKPTDPGCNQGCLSQTDKPTIDKWNNDVAANNGVVIVIIGKPTW
jgi:hypothetical protein